jgi:hypothetical protein
MLPRIRRHARILSDLGPRQTGQQGCDRALDYARGQLETILDEAGLDAEIKEFSSPVTVTLDRTRPEELDSTDERFTHLLVHGLEDDSLRWPAHSFQANCVQPCRTHPQDRCPRRRQGRSGPFCRDCQQSRPLVDLGAGLPEDFRDCPDLTGAVVLLDFNSSDAWLEAARLGAYGAIFIEPERTTVFQADQKYRVIVPLHFPRVYVRSEQGLRLREALAAGRSVEVTLATRLRWTNDVEARCLELTIPGRSSDYAFILAAHLDARSIVPDLAFGGQEVWGPAELLELTRHFAHHRPACDLRIFFTTGHWQGQKPMRDYLAYDPEREGHFEQANRYFRLAMGVDLVPQDRSINLISEAPWDIQSIFAYQWLRPLLFNPRGWRDEVLFELGLADEGVTLYGGRRPYRAVTRYGMMAKQNDRSPLIYAPRYQTAEGAWQSLGMTTFAFQTQRLARLNHYTPLDRIRPMPPE